MTATTGGPGGLGALGVGEAEERVYRVLVDRPRMTAAELAEAAGMPAARVRRAVRDLVTSGLVVRQDGTPARFVPAPPDVAVEALVLRRQEELQRARLSAAELLERFRRQALLGPAAELVEVVQGREAIERCSERIVRGARREVLVFDRPPYVGPMENLLERELLARGVVFRAVYAAEALEPPGRLAEFESMRRAGERARVAPTVPVKLLVVDGRRALLPLTSGLDDATGTAMLVHRCALLVTLTDLFEIYWQRAVAVPGALAPAAPDAVDRELLLMLAAGFKDEVIARRLGVSLRTARRRLSRLLRANGVETRFQLGLVAARNGWIPREPTETANS